MWIVPDNRDFTEIDQLIDEVERITYLEQKYNNPDSEEGKILLGFSTAKSEKQNRIQQLIEKVLKSADLVYLFNVLKLNDDNAISTVQSQEKQLINNVYTKRLNAQLSDEVAKAVIKETNDKRLQQYFHGEDFGFFDNQGNFIGDNLKVTEEITYKIRNTFVDGKTLELELEQPPTGYSFGTVITTIATLMRAGKIIAKYNGEDKFSWRDSGIINIFSAAREFRKASFKAISKSLSLQQKQLLVQFLLDIEAGQYTGKKIDYNTNDFELVNAVRELAKHFSDKVTTLNNSEREFERLFPTANRFKELLDAFTGPVSEANYIDKAVVFLDKKDDYLEAVQEIIKIEKFIRNKLAKVNQWKNFADAVSDELEKAAKTDDNIKNSFNDFIEEYNRDVMGNYGKLQQIAQKIKDRYHENFSAAMVQCAEKYQEISRLAQDILDEIKELPEGLNIEAKQKAQALKQYADQRTRENIELDYDVKDKISRFTYSEVLSFIELYGSKKNEAEIIKAGLVKEIPVETEPGKPVQPKVIKTKLPAHKMKVAEYKQWLTQELQKLAAANDNDEIDIEK